MIRRLRTDLALAIGFFTRLPVGWLMPRDPAIAMGRAIWAFPVAGALVGLLGAAAYTGADRLGLSPLLSACWTLAAMLVLTGGLHEDGLADTMDALGGGGDIDRRLAIMRDSRIGSYGAMALLASSLLRVSAIATLADPRLVALALVASCMLSRAAIILVVRLSPPARAGGLAALLHPLGLRAAGLGLVLTVIAIPPLVSVAVAPVLLGGALLCGVGVARLCVRQFGGHTGDVLGACSVVTEAVLLTICCTSWSGLRPG
ncbi:adenosylcobinamide-GDP ribazoletransferase [Lichenicoccus roseus]|uniref:Adenosylcobinamide-GDP ribazoletransferase n=1 Tax=Lichenicoccus roseus TaxID=2683649 RepID=A0A5R9J0G0_9PROT|nr:adenosylcobinamide-GDP ribazoletransferase [Lichenicoccus roseus]TLU71022.1 adenosylcobinamide-GDP ribazoletransferase [Lichenicoccus roseus]